MFNRLPARLREPALMEWRLWKAKARGSYFSLNDLDRKMLKHLDYSNGYYVELGANDGQTQSNTLHYELRRNWHGILIEPLPHRYVECQRFRGKRNKVVCAACVPFDYSERFVPIRTADLMTTTEGFVGDRSADEHHTSARGHFAIEETYEFAASARTLTSILEEADAPPTMDLLSLDVEGAELAVLAGLDHSTFRFKFALVETRSPEDVEQALSGYEIIEQLSHHDYLFRNSEE